MHLHLWLPFEVLPYRLPPWGVAFTLGQSKATRLKSIPVIPGARLGNCKHPRAEFPGGSLALEDASPGK